MIPLFILAAVVEMVIKCRLFVLIAMRLCHEARIFWSNNFVSPRSSMNLDRLYSYISNSDCSHIFRSMDGSQDDSKIAIIKGNNFDKINTVNYVIT